MNVEQIFKLANSINLPQQASPDQTAPGSIAKGQRWKAHTLEALQHLKRSGYSL